jgi:hypothetical protein
MAWMWDCGMKQHPGFKTSMTGCVRGLILLWIKPHWSSSQYIPDHISLEFIQGKSEGPCRTQELIQEGRRANLGEDLQGVRTKYSYLRDCLEGRLHAETMRMSCRGYITPSGRPRRMWPEKRCIAICDVTSLMYGGSMHECRVWVSRVQDILIPTDWTVSNRWTWP